LDKAVICRIVRDKDVVPTVPPEVFGFRHLDKLVYITDDGKIIINPNLGSDNVIDTSTMNELLSTYPALMESEIEEAKEEGTETESTYDKRIRMVPRALRDHMPDFYLVPLIKLFEREVAGDGMVAVKNVSVPSESVAQ
jgi:regulator of extracellular matrix RemA (YlzA/DUF370 family)